MKKIILGIYFTYSIGILICLIYIVIAYLNHFKLPFLDYKSRNNENTSLEEFEMANSKEIQEKWISNYKNQQKKSSIIYRTHDNNVWCLWKAFLENLQPFAFQTKYVFIRKKSTLLIFITDREPFFIDYKAFIEGLCRSNLDNIFPLLFSFFDNMKYNSINRELNDTYATENLNNIFVLNADDGKYEFFDFNNQRSLISTESIPNLNLTQIFDDFRNST